MTDQDLQEGHPSVKQPEGVTMADLHALDQIVRPYFEGNWKNELDKAKLDTDFKLKVLEVEFKFRKWMMIGTFTGIFVILALAFYLFVTDRDDDAMKIVVGIVLVVMTFIAGRGLSSSRRSARTEDD